MKNPWKNCDLDVYENHMKFESVGQLQLLSKIMKSQFFDYSVDTLAIWGIAGGNGLEHISIGDFSKIYCIDINQNYLNKVKERYSNLENIIVLNAIDLNDLSVNLNQVDLVIADLLIEYVGINNFITQINKSNPKYISVVIQKEVSDINFVSESPYFDKLDFIGEFAVNINEDELIKSLEKENYSGCLIKEYVLPDSKKFLRLDFKKSN